MKFFKKNPTSQNAPLEKLLSYFRYKRTIKYIRDKKVLDFGCGTKNWNSEFIGKYPKLIHGLDRSITSSSVRENKKMHVFKEINDLPFSEYEIILSMSVF